MEYNKDKNKCERIECFCTEMEASAFVQGQLEQIPDADVQVLQFIDLFYTYNTNNEDEQEVLRKQFHAGYCYYFAVMLQAAFNRGEICWCAPFGHICWVDVDGIPYDVEGICISEAEYYIPVSYLGGALADFKHVPGVAYNATKDDPQKIIERYLEDKKNENI